MADSLAAEIAELRGEQKVTDARLNRVEDDIRSQGKELGELRTLVWKALILGSGATALLGGIGAAIGSYLKSP